MDECFCRAPCLEVMTLAKLLIVIQGTRCFVIEMCFLNSTQWKTALHRPQLSSYSQPGLLVNLKDDSAAVCFPISQISFQMDYAFGSRVGPWLDTIHHHKAYTPRECLLCWTVKCLNKEMVMGLRMGEGEAGHLFCTENEEE